jgi:hypothetical protein
MLIPEDNVGGLHAEESTSVTRHQCLRGAAALLLLASGGLVAAQSAAKLPADLDPDSRARLPFLQQKDFDGLPRTRARLAQRR